MKNLNRFLSIFIVVLLARMVYFKFTGSLTPNAYNGSVEWRDVFNQMNYLIPEATIISIILLWALRKDKKEID